MSLKNASLEKGLSPVGLEQTIGYRFENQALLRQALTHLSYAHEKQTEANARLALLGDSLLNMTFTWKLYQQDPNATPGQLTERRKSYVSQGALCRLATEIDLERYLFLGNGEIRVSPRMLADAFESLVGAIFLDGGFEAVNPFLDRAFGQIEKDEKGGSRPC